MPRSLRIYSFASTLIVNVQSPSIGFHSISLQHRKTIESLSYACVLKCRFFNVVSLLCACPRNNFISACRMHYSYIIADMFSIKFNCVLRTSLCRYQFQEVGYHTFQICRELSCDKASFAAPFAGVGSPIAVIQSTVIQSISSFTIGK